MNIYLIGATREMITVNGLFPNTITKEKALNLAAWIILLADPLGAEKVSETDSEIGRVIKKEMK